MKHYTKINDIALEAMQNKWIPGYAMRLFNHDIRETYRDGVACDGGFSITEDSLYDIASLTKIFITTRILQLIDRKSLSLETPIQAILPNFKVDDLSVFECLTHLSGMLPSVSGRYDMTQSQIYESVLRADDYKASQRGQMVYSCINFILLGMLIEHIDGSLSESLATHIWKPLKMFDTTYNPQTLEHTVPTEIIDGKLRHGSVHDETAHALGGVAGNAGIFSTLHDMSLFVDAYLNPDGSVITDAMIASIQTTQIQGRSLGWNLLPFEERLIPFHTGFTGPILCIDFETSKAFLLLTNRVYPSRIDTGFLEHRTHMVENFLKK